MCEQMLQDNVFEVCVQNVLTACLSCPLVRTCKMLCRASYVESAPSFTFVGIYARVVAADDVVRPEVVD